MRLSRYYSPSSTRVGRPSRAAKEGNESRNTTVDKYYTVIGLSSAQIAMSRDDRRFSGVSFFFSFLSASARRPRGRRNVGEGTEYLSTIIIAVCVMYHVVLQADSSVYTHTHGASRSYPPRGREKEREERRERERRRGPFDTRTRPCISRRFDRAGHYRRRNKSKPREQAWPFAIRRRERKLHKSPRANDVLPRTGGLMSSGPCCGRTRAGCRRKVRVP